MVWDLLLVSYLFWDIVVYVISQVQKYPPSYIPLNYIITAVEMLLVPLFVMSLIFLVQHFGVTFRSIIFLNPLGVISYEIYLWHIPVFYTLKGYLSNYYVTIILTILITVCVSSLLKYKQLKTVIHVGNH